MWTLTHGEIPEGMQVLHKCDTRPCVNPDHLFLGTNNDNVQDKIRKGRENTPWGEQVNTAKLTAEQVKEIRDLYAAGGITQQVIADRYGINQRAVSAIICRVNWARLNN
jgi:HNH endonuclease